LLSIVGLCIVAGLLGIRPSAGQATTGAFAVQLSATVQASPPQIVLSWPADPYALGVRLYKRPLAGATNFNDGWQLVASNAAFITSYSDAAVTPGVLYEYKATSSVLGFTDPVVGMITTGIQVPLTEQRGKVILIVDAAHSVELSVELSRLQQDLVGDGWSVIRHDVQATDAPTDIKALIQADYNADPANVRSVFLIGAVPVPYSGPVSPAGHPDNYVPWPADVYYGVMTGTWTPGALLAGYPNYFSNTMTPAEATLEVGRVDLRNLPSFAPKSEVDLLRQYLDKDHNFRQGIVTAPRRALITDHFALFGYLGIEDFAATAYSSFSALFGAANVNDTAWISPISNDLNSDLTFPTLQNNSYLWTCIDSGGLNTSNGVYYTGTSMDWATRDPMAVFTMSFGSYFGDWNCPDNFLRAPLADASMTLSNSWSGRPRQFYNRTAMGLTLGDSVRVSQNTERETWTALMGDPTLRVFTVAPPAGLIAQASGSSVTLSWAASPDAGVQGYNVYRAVTAAGPYVKLTAQPISATTYTDSTAPPAVDCYMVRAVKLETTASGTFTNASTGIFATATVSGTAPSISLVGPGSGSILATPGGPATVPLAAVASGVSGSIGAVTFFANGIKIGATSTLGPISGVGPVAGPGINPSAKVAAIPVPTVPGYSYAWTAAPGTYVVTAVATDAAGNTTTSEPASISVRSLLPPQINATLTSGATLLPGGTFTVSAVAVTQNPSDQVVRVQLLSNGAMVSELKTSDLPYNFNWSLSQQHAVQPYPYGLSYAPTAAGSYQLVARAVTRLGMSADSAPIGVTVTATSPPPTIAITSPTDGAQIAAGATTPVTVSVTAPISNNPVVRVDLLANGAKMATATAAPFTTSLAPAGPGKYVLTALATDTLGNTGTSPAVTVTVGTSANGLRINAAGTSVGTFSADGFYTGGSTYSTDHAIDVTGVASPAPAAAYQTLRYSNTQFGYVFPGLTAGASYTVRLHFQEAGWSSAGKRLFDVGANGNALLSGFDVYAAAGAMYKAVVKEFSVNADSGGVISLAFAGTPGAVDPTPFVCALEVLPAGSTAGLAPATPTGLSATAGSGNVTLGWNGVTGATSYNVYRSTATGAEGATAYKSGLAAPTFGDTGVVNGTTYYYRVSAVNANGESAQSAEASARPGTVPYQINAAGVAVGSFAADGYFTNGSSWSTTHTIVTSGVNSPAPMAAYQSLRYSNGQFSYTFPGLAAGGSYLLRLHFQEAGWSSAGKRLFDVNANGAPLLSGFDVYAAAGAMYKAVVKELTVTADSSGKVNVGFAGTPGAVDPTPFVCALELLPGGTISGQAPTTPTGLVATPGTAQVSLSWATVTGATSYNVYRSLTAGGEGALPYKTGVATPTLLDTGLTGATTYYYRVSAVSAFGEGSQSVEASAKLGGALYQVNAAGGTVGTFSADSYFTGGSTWSTAQPIDTSKVTNPAPIAAYQSLRYGSSPFSYAFTSLAPGGTYKLRLHFQESGWNAAGKRLFNVGWNGNTLLSSFDVYAAAGGMYKAVVKEFTVFADRTGKINLTFTGTPGAVDPTPFVCAIELTN
jgi:hypothetical protein